MIKKLIIFTWPLLILIDLVVLGWVAALVRQPSDLAVFEGVAILCVILAANYLLITFLVKEFKKTSK